MDKKYKKEGFKVPEDYFEGLSQRVLNRLKEEGDGLPKDDGFSVPEGYFEGLEEKLRSRTESDEEPRVIRMKPWKKYYFAAASVAAILVIAIVIRLNRTDEFTFSDLANAELESYLYEGDLELSTYEIAEVLPLEDIEVNDILDTALNDENILDYLDENVEDLDELNFEYNE